VTAFKRPRGPACANCVHFERCEYNPWRGSCLLHNIQVYGKQACPDYTPKRLEDPSPLL